MPRDINGNYSVPETSYLVAGQEIPADHWNRFLADFAAAVNQQVKKTAVSPKMLQTLFINGRKVTNLPAADVESPYLMLDKASIIPTFETKLRATNLQIAAAAATVTFETASANASQIVQITGTTQVNNFAGGNGPVFILARGPGLTFGASGNILFRGVAQNWAIGVDAWFVTWKSGAFWYLFPIDTQSGVPLLTEAGEELLTEDGDIILTEY